MVDFKKYKHGKDEEAQQGTEIGGGFYTDLDLILAMAKALIKNGVLTKQQLKDEL